MSLTVAASTTTQKLEAGIIVALSRNPLCDARQAATVNQLSNGRLLFGAGKGWLQDEYPILGLDYNNPGKRIEECIEVYTRAWTEDVVFHRRNERSVFKAVGSIPARG